VLSKDVVMNVIKTADDRNVHRLSKADWHSIGKKAGWFVPQVADSGVRLTQYLDYTRPMLNRGTRSKGFVKAAWASDREMLS